MGTWWPGWFGAVGIDYKGELLKLMVAFWHSPYYGILVFTSWGWILLVYNTIRLKAFVFLWGILFFFFTTLLRYNLCAIPFTYFCVQLNGFVSVYVHLQIITTVPFRTLSPPGMFPRASFSEPCSYSPALGSHQPAFRPCNSAFFRNCL